MKHLTKMLNRIYSREHLPEDLRTSVLIALPKNPGATECGQHCTISLMSQTTKLLVRIIMLKKRIKIKLEITEQQCDFGETKGTTDAMYILRTLEERAIGVQEDLYLCFIDYNKAFDTIKHENLNSILTTLNIDGRDL